MSSILLNLLIIVPFTLKYVFFSLNSGNSLYNCSSILTKRSVFLHAIGKFTVCSPLIKCAIIIFSPGLHSKFWSLLLLFKVFNSFLNFIISSFFEFNSNFNELSWEINLLIWSFKLRLVCFSLVISFNICLCLSSVSFNSFENWISLLFIFLNSLNFCFNLFNSSVNLFVLSFSIFKSLFNFIFLSFSFFNSLFNSNTLLFYIFNCSDNDFALFFSVFNEFNNSFELLFVFVLLIVIKSTNDSVWY